MKLADEATLIASGRYIINFNVVQRIAEGQDMYAVLLNLADGKQPTDTSALKKFEKSKEYSVLTK